MAAWPTTLPAPAINSLKESPPNNVLRTSVDKGPAKTRKRTTANTRPISFMLNLLPADVTTLDDFYNANCAIPFDYIHPRTGAACSAKFVELPQYSEREGVDYTASISLEILP